MEPPPKGAQRAIGCGLLLGCLYLFLALLTCLLLPLIGIVCGIKYLIQ